MSYFDSPCSLCPNLCGAVRSETAGACGAGGKIKIAKFSLHPYEEPCISLGKGSGTVFFCGCPLGCVFCQNYDVSRNKVGREITVRELADIFKRLEDMGAENINLVNPTHYVPLIGEAFALYRPKLPVVYNTHGYERTETLLLANEFTDIYLTDMKFFSPSAAARYSGHGDYFSVASRAAEFMIKCRKTRIIGGKMESGVIVRHLILPLNITDTLEIVRWFAGIQSDAYFSLMAQYTPFGEIENFPELKRKITRREYSRALAALEEAGIENCFVQELSSSGEQYIPVWDF